MFQQYLCPLCYGEAKWFLDCYSDLSLLVQAKSTNGLVGDLVFILVPERGVEPSDLPLAQHLLPIQLRSLLES